MAKGNDNKFASFQTMPALTAEEVEASVKGKQTGDCGCHGNPAQCKCAPGECSCTSCNKNNCCDKKEVADESKCPHMSSKKTCPAVTKCPYVHSHCPHYGGHYYYRYLSTANTVAQWSAIGVLAYLALRK